jgi:hypothetical protein
MLDPIIGHRQFEDGTTRPIFEDLAGRQYVKGDDGELVYGVRQIVPCRWIQEWALGAEQRARANAESLRTGHEETEAP